MSSPRFGDPNKRPLRIVSGYIQTTLHFVCAIIHVFVVLLSGVSIHLIGYGLHSPDSSAYLSSSTNPGQPILQYQPMPYGTNLGLPGRLFLTAPSIYDS